MTANRFAPAVFDERNIAPLGYAAFAIALGATLGLLPRRTLPAMAVTLAVFVGIQILMPTLIRPNLLSSKMVTVSVNRTTANQALGIYTSGGGAEFYIQLPVPPGAWVTAAPPVENSSGQVVTRQPLLAAPDVRNRDLPRTRRRTFRLVLLVDTASTELN